ncbi:MAG: GIY-YIG nuclease family protein [Pseudohongiellaceae bacterium]
MSDNKTKHLIAPAFLSGTTPKTAGAAYGVIYLALCVATGKCYIGQTTDYEHRYRCHLTRKSGCRAFSCAIKKHGADLFQWRIIGVAMTQSALDEAEIFAIRHYRTLAPNGYNLREGGEGGKPSDETREKMKVAWKSRLTPEYRAKLSAALTGRKLPPFTPERCAAISARVKGRRLSPITRAKLSAAHKGKKRGSPSAITRAKLSAALKGRVFSAEHLANMSASLRGIKRSPEEVARISAFNRGSKRSDETRAKMSAAAIRRWGKRAAVITPQGGLI